MLSKGLCWLSSPDLGGTGPDEAETGRYDGSRAVVGPHPDAFPLLVEPLGKVQNNPLVWVPAHLSCGPARLSSLLQVSFLPYYLGVKSGCFSRKSALTLLP